MAKQMKRKQNANDRKDGKLARKRQHNQFDSCNVCHISVVEFFLPFLVFSFTISSISNSLHNLQHTVWENGKREHKKQLQLNQSIKNEGKKRQKRLVLLLCALQCAVDSLASAKLAVVGCKTRQSYEGRKTAWCGWWSDVPMW